MREEIKKLWVEALRSGKYKQGRGQLRCADTFCCLGVLCDLHSREIGDGWDTLGGAPLYDGETLLLPLSVIQWAGLDADAFGQNPIVTGPGSADILDHSSGIANFNDGAGLCRKLTFPEIADLIEKHL